MSLFKKKPVAPPQAGGTSVQMRDLLFGDLPLERWMGDGKESPWSEFARAQTLLRNGDRAGAIATLEALARLSDVEARHTLQAWHLLRELGVQPPTEIAKEVLGVVVEVGMDQGLDVLAAYRDHHARYWNWSGAGVVWEHPDERLDLSIDALLRAGQQVASVIGPWEGVRPAAVVKGNARVIFLTPSGLHFGEARFADLAKDPLSAPVINTATQLMRQMTELAPR